MFGLDDEECMSITASASTATIIPNNHLNIKEGKQNYGKRQLTGILCSFFLQSADKNIKTISVLISKAKQKLKQGA